MCSGSAAKRLYYPLRGAYYRSCEGVVLRPDSRLRPLSGVKDLATCVRYYERIVLRRTCISVMRLSACPVACTYSTETLICHKLLKKQNIITISKPKKDLKLN